jgi:hypothetical protein
MQTAAKNGGFSWKAVDSGEAGEACVEWTAAMAQYAIDHRNNHPQQRKKSPSDYEKWARVMKDGHWVPNFRGNWIVFDTNGNIINGQHTLKAIALSGVTVSIRTAWGDDPAMIALYDNFKPRGNAYLLACMGANNTSQRNAFARLRVLLDEGVKHPKVSPHEVLDYTAAENDPIADEFVCGVKARNKTFMAAGFSCSVASYAGWKIAKVHGSQRAWEFLDRVASGEGLDANDPRLQLARALRQSRYNNDEERQRGVTLVIKAFNMYVTGKRGILRASTSEAVPDVLGWPKH